MYSSCGPLLSVASLSVGLPNGERYPGKVFRRDHHGLPYVRRSSRGIWLIHDNNLPESRFSAAPDDVVPGSGRSPGLTAPPPARSLLSRRGLSASSAPWHRGRGPRGRRLRAAGSQRPARRGAPITSCLSLPVDEDWLSVRTFLGVRASPRLLLAHGGLVTHPYRRRPLEYRR